MNYSKLIVQNTSRGSIRCIGRSLSQPPTNSTGDAGWDKLHLSSSTIVFYLWSKYTRSDFDSRIDARLQALQNGDVDALILAKVGLKCLNLLEHWHCSDIPLDLMLPGICQGIIAVVSSCTDNPMISQLWGADRNHHPSAVASAAERAFLDVVDQLSPWKGHPLLAGLMQYNLHGKYWTFRGPLATPDGKNLAKKSSQNLNAG